MDLKHRFLIGALTLILTFNFSVSPVYANVNLPPQMTNEKMALTTAILAWSGMLVVSGTQAYHAAENLYDKFKDKITEVGDNYVIKPDASVVDDINSNIANINTNIVSNPSYTYQYGESGVFYGFGECAYVFSTPGSAGRIEANVDVNITHNGTAYQEYDKTLTAFADSGQSINAIVFDYLVDGTTLTSTDKISFVHCKFSNSLNFSYDGYHKKYLPSESNYKISSFYLSSKTYSTSDPIQIRVNSIKFTDSTTEQVYNLIPNQLVNISQVEITVPPSPIDLSKFNVDALKAKLAETPISIVIPKNTIPNIDITKPDSIVVPSQVVEKDVNTPEDLPTPTEPTDPVNPGINYTSILTDILNAIKSIPQLILDLPGKVFDFFKTLLQEILDAIKSIPDLIRSIPDLIINLPSKLIDLLRNLLKEIFIPGEQFIKDNFDQLKNEISIKYNNDLNILDSLKVDAEEFNDVKVTLYGKEMTILSAQPIKNNITWIRMVTSMFFIFLLIVYVYNQIYFLIRGTYPIVTSSKTTLSGGEGS